MGSHDVNALLAKAFAEDLARSSELRTLIEEGVSPYSLRLIIRADLEREVSGTPGEKLFPSLRAFLRERVKAEASRPVSGMGDAFSDIIGSLTTVVGTGITVTQNRRIAEDQRKAAEAQLRQQELALKQMEVAQAAQKINFEPPAPAITETLSKIAVPVGIGAAVLVGGYFLLR